MKYAKFFLFLFALLPLAAGCVKEDADECNSIVTLRFSYTGDNGSEIFPEKIEHVGLFVFDENHVPVLRHELTPEELASRSIRLSLPMGRTYNVVSIGNGARASVVDLETGTFVDTKIMHPATRPDAGTESRSVDSHDHLYHGNTCVTVPYTGETEQTVSFSAAHYDVIVEVAGFMEENPVRTDGEPAMYIEHTNLPAWTGFDNTCPSDDNVSHFPASVYRDGVYVHEYNVMRNLDDSFVHLYDSSHNLIHTVDVMAFVATHPEIDLNKHEVLVPIRIECLRAGGFEVTIPDWAVEQTVPEF